MWKCEKCGEELKDKYKFCWNCQTPKPAGLEPEIKYKRIEEAPKVKVESVPIVKVEPIVEPKKELPKVEPKVEATPKPSNVVQTDFLSSSYDIKNEAKPTSIIWTIIPVLIWLAVTVGVGYFAYLSNQKTTAFNNKILTDAQNFNAQKSQFVFPTTALPDRKNQYKIEGNIIGKVLPLNRKTNEVAELYYSLPDDLRATNADDAKTIFYLDCQNEQVGKFPDGSTGFQEKCNTFLVNLASAKFIGVQDFIGIPPAFAKKTGNGDETGKVLAERYITYLREKQIATERSEMKYPSDSPNHHYFSQSEFILAVGLLIILGAIGLGWLFFRIKSLFNAN